MNHPFRVCVYEFWIWWIDDGEQAYRSVCFVSLRLACINIVFFSVELGRDRTEIKEKKNCTRTHFDCVVCSFVYFYCNNITSDIYLCASFFSIRRFLFFFAYFGLILLRVVINSNKKLKLYFDRRWSHISFSIRFDFGLIPLFFSLSPSAYHCCINWNDFDVQHGWIEVQPLLFVALYRHFVVRKLLQLATIFNSHHHLLYWCFLFCSFVCVTTKLLIWRNNFIDY